MSALENLMNQYPVAASFVLVMMIVGVYGLFKIAVQLFYYASDHISTDELKDRLVKKHLEEKAALPKNEHFFERYAFVVGMAMKRFPEFKVWGEHIQDNSGYGVFVSNGIKTSMFQVRSQILIDGKPHLNDILEVSQVEGEKLIHQAFDAIDKSLKEAVAHEAAKKVAVVR